MTDDPPAPPVDTAGDLGAPATVVVAERDPAVDQRTAPDVTARIVAWAGRLTAAGLVAAAVALVIDGVLAV